MLATTGAAMISLLASDPGSAQTRPARAVPGDDYILAFNPFYDGEYLTALRAFRSAAKSGVRSTEGVWIDAICYSTMMGECFYHLGDFKSAVAQYEVALELHLAHRGWLKRIQLPPRIQGPTPTQPLPWGPSGRPTAPARLPDTYLSLQGTNTEQVVRQGGIFAPPELYPVRVNEILRCLALAMRRRAELLGPLSTESPLSGQLVREFSAARVPAGHWMGALLSVCKGLAQLNDGDSKAALQTLQRSLVIAGRLDHPLTDTALLEIGKIAVEADNLSLAKQSFYEATFPAAFYRHGDVLQEAFQWAAAAHRISNPQQPYPPLAPAASWARVKGFRRVHVSLLLDSIDQLSLSGQDRLATGLLSQARRGMGRSDLIRSDVGARLQYLQSRLAQRQGKSAAALAALKGAVALQRNHSARLYQIARQPEPVAARHVYVSPRRISGTRDKALAVATARYTDRPNDSLATADRPSPGNRLGPKRCSSDDMGQRPAATR